MEAKGEVVRPERGYAILKCRRIYNRLLVHLGLAIQSLQLGAWP